MKRSISAELDDEKKIVPLQKFSTQSLVEKNSWMGLPQVGMARGDGIQEEQWLLQSWLFLGFLHSFKLLASPEFADMHAVDPFTQEFLNHQLKRQSHGQLSGLKPSGECGQSARTRALQGATSS